MCDKMMSKELGNEFSVVSTNNQSEVLLPNSPIYTGKFGYVRFAQFGPICTTVQLYNCTIVQWYNCTIFIKSNSPRWVFFTFFKLQK